jgi:hypothetical protein
MNYLITPDQGLPWYLEQPEHDGIACFEHVRERLDWNWNSYTVSLDDQVIERVLNPQRLERRSQREQAERNR